MQTHKIILSYIDVVRTFAKVKVQDADRIYLLHFLVGISKIDMFRNSLSHTIKYTFQIIQFTCILDFYYNDIALAVFCLDVNSIELVIFSLLVTFTFQYINDFDWLSYKYGKKALQNAKISLLAQQSFYSPIKAYKSIS